MNVCFNKSYLVLCILIIVVVLSGCISTNNNQNISNNNTSLNSVNTSSSQVVVTIKNFAFNPVELNIKKGTTVKWINNDGMAHTVTSKGNFDSGRLDSGESFEFTFEQTQEYDYLCSYHPSMTAKIIVGD